MILGCIKMKNLIETIFIMFYFLLSIPIIQIGSSIGTFDFIFDYINFKYYFIIWILFTTLIIIYGIYDFIQWSNIIGDLH